MKHTQKLFTLAAPILASFIGSAPASPNPTPRTTPEAPTTTPTPSPTETPPRLPPTPSLSDIARTKRSRIPTDSAPRFNIYGLKITQSEDLITVTGVVENTGSRTACEVVVSFTVAEARGATLATKRVTPEPATIPPGHRSPFSGSFHIPAAFQQDPTFRLAEPTAQVIAYTKSCQS